MSHHSLREAAASYATKFGRNVTTINLPEDKEAEATILLEQAIEIDTPFENDAAWFKALGMDPPPDDAQI